MNTGTQIKLSRSIEDTWAIFLKKYYTGWDDYKCGSEDTNIDLDKTGKRNDVIK